MAEKLIGSLIYGDHPEPKKARPLKDRLKVPLSLFLALVLIGGLLYKFVNYREEAHVERFMEAVATGRFDEAYAMWDGDERYDMNDFLEDWGADGFYTSDLVEYDVIDSNSRGSSVIVYARLNGVVVAILADKETLLLSFSPENKYSRR